jgi:dolichol-phosphate mannosyltransferase
MRLVGNAALSFISKLSTGYWNLFDTTNGFTAIHARVARRIAFDKVSPRYFFESDMLFRLNIIRAVVADIPMDATYGDEKSNLKISRVIGEFMAKHARNFAKRVLYNYFLRDMTVASLELIVGTLLFIFGLVFGGYHWLRGIASGAATPLGTIMLAALPTMLGLQMLLAFVAFDVANVPRTPIHPDLAD